MDLLTKLPDELLLKIIAAVSPLDLEDFLLCCKRIYCLRADATREFCRVRSSLDSLNKYELTARVLSDPSAACFTTLVQIVSRCTNHHRNIVIPPPPVNAQILKDSFMRHYHARYPRPDLVIPLLLSSLLNLRKSIIKIGHSPYIHEIIAQIVEASHEPSFIPQEPLALGKLKEIEIQAFPPDSRCSATCSKKMDAELAMKLSSLFAMIPTVRKLRVLAYDHSRYVAPRPYYTGGVTELSLWGSVDSTFLEDLIGRTKRLEKFLYRHEISDALSPPANFAPRRVAQLLQLGAGDSLRYLNLTLRPHGQSRSNDHLRRYRKDLFIGPLHGLTALKKLRTSVDLLIETRRIGRNHAKTHAKTGTVQSLAWILPSSVEILLLEEGLKAWDGATMRLLFEDIVDWKEPGTAKLNEVAFLDCRDFEDLMSHETKTTCQQAGVKLAYSTKCPRFERCDRVFGGFGNWEERPWITALRCSCQATS